jgi:hypothetical protein
MADQQVDLRKLRKAQKVLADYFECWRKGTTATWNESTRHAALTSSHNTLPITNTFLLDTEPNITSNARSPSREDGSATTACMPLLKHSTNLITYMRGG